MDRNFHGPERIWGEMHKYIELESSLEVEERGKLPKGYKKKVMSESKRTRKGRKLAHSSRSVQQTLPRPFEQWTCKVAVNPGEVVVMPCHEERPSRTKQVRLCPFLPGTQKRKWLQTIVCKLWPLENIYLCLCVKAVSLGIVPRIDPRMMNQR